MMKIIIVIEVILIMIILIIIKERVSEFINLILSLP